MIHVWYRSNIWFIYVTYQIKSIVSQAFVGLLIFSDACESATPSRPDCLVGLIMVGWFNQSTHLWSCAPPKTYAKLQIDDFYEESPKNKGWNSHCQVLIILGRNHLQFVVYGRGKRSMKPVRCWTASVPWETAKPNAPRCVNLLRLQDRGENCVQESTGKPSIVWNTYSCLIEWQSLDLGWGVFATETDDCWDIEPPHQSNQKGSLIGWLEESEDAL